MYKKYFKRILDFSISLFLIFISSPILIFISIILFVDNKGKVLFIQKRPGKNEMIFSILKFKTMRDTKNNAGDLLPDHKRITSIGRFIRKTSLDELPQLVNVLKGDLSLIGPRPLLVDYLRFYNSFQRRRHEVKPGITGWAQVNGRNTLTWAEKFNYDIWYIDNLSFRLDMKILFMTCWKVFHFKSVNKSETITMEKFNGNN